MKTNQLRNYSELRSNRVRRMHTDLSYTLINTKTKESLEKTSGSSSNKGYIQVKLASRPSWKNSTRTSSNSSQNYRSQSIDHQERLYSGSIDDYVFGHTLGLGAYAVVKQAVYVQKKQQFAIKTYEKSKMLDAQRKKNVISEIKVLKALCHPHIVKLKEAIDCTKQIHLVMEYVSGSSLWSYLKKKPNRMLPETIARRYFSQIASGVHYCHGMNIIHRDLKLENIMLDTSNNVKIIDFGFATFTTLGNKIKLFCGTPSYMAPEIVGKRENPGAPADIWALGVVLYVMLVGAFPFKGTNDRDLYRLILKGTYDLPGTLSFGAKNLIRKLLQQDPKKRPTSAQLLSDPWVVEYKQKDPSITDENLNTNVNIIVEKIVSIAPRRDRSRPLLNK